MLNNFQDLIEQVKKIEPRKVSVAVAEDEAVLRAVRDAAKLGFIKPILVGNKEKICKIADEIGFLEFQVIDCENEVEAMKTAVSLVKNKEADVLMKGLVNTAVYMRGILNKE